MGRMSSFNGSNWVTWKTKMEDLLFCKDLYGPIEGDSNKSKDGSFSKKDIECYYCHEKGHMKRECRKFKNKEKRRDKSVDKK